MNNRENNNNEFKHLFNSSDIIPKEAEIRLERQFVNFRKRFSQAGETSSSIFERLWMKKPLAWSGAAAFGLILVLAVSFFINPSNHSAYAKTLEALQSVRSVHIDGWTHDIEIFISGSIAVSSEPKVDKLTFSVWEWAEPDGSFKLYGQCGLKTIYQDREKSYIYDGETQEMRISDHVAQRYIKMAPVMVTRLVNNLERTNWKVADLGVKTIDGNVCFGRRSEMAYYGEKHYDEYWFSVETALPHVISHSKQCGEEIKKIYSLSMSYNEPVPEDVKNYKPPKTEKKDYSLNLDPVSDPWREHLKSLADYYETHPLPEFMELIPRKSLKHFSSYYFPASMPGIEGYSVAPITFDLELYSRWRAGQLRIMDDALPIEINHDLVYKEGTKEEDRILFTIDALGLGVRETKENRTVWVAKHDGREFKPWREVKPPVDENGKEIRISGNGECYADTLFEDLIVERNPDWKANGVFIIDETGLPKTPAGSPVEKPLSTIRPDWSAVSDNIIKEWFLTEFGIRFEKEERSVVIYEVYKK